MIRSKKCKGLSGLIVLTGTLCGCSIIPGLHVNEEPIVAGGYEVREEAGAEVYKPTKEDQRLGYRLVEITPKTIVGLRKAASERGLGTAEELGSTTPAIVPPEYVIGPGDVVSIVVWDHPELTNPTGEFRDAVSAGRLLSSTGTIFYPYVGEFKAAGMTVTELRRYLGEQLARVIKTPQVDARVVAFRAQRVQVTGEVKQPGLVTLDDTPKGILEAINERGGLTEVSSRRRVRLIRGGKTYSIELARLLSGDLPSVNPPLRPGDIVHIPDRSGDQVFVLGEVNKQGPTFLQQDRTTLTEALAVSGGLDKLTAEDSGVLVFRRPGEGDTLPTVFRLDLSAPTGLLLAGEFDLQPRDVVYVKATGFAKYNSVINQLLPTISAVFQLDALINNR